MCVIAAKYFKDYGWVGVKNRDRTYKPNILIKKSHRDNIDRIYIWDENTRYTEGLNENGTSILNASFGRNSDYGKGEKDEEDQIHAEGDDPDYYSKDGKIIRTALLESTLKDTIRVLIDMELAGCCLIFDKDNCYVLEADYINDKYKHKLRHIPKTETIVRTNHGILLPQAGFQRGSKHEKVALKRVSSELRKFIADKLLEFADDPEEMINTLLYQRSRNKQFNLARMDFEDGHVRTTGQLLIIPKYYTLFYRPVSSDIEYDANRRDSKLHFKLITNKNIIRNHDK